MAVSGDHKAAFRDVHVTKFTALHLPKHPDNGRQNRMFLDPHQACPVSSDKKRKNQDVRWAALLHRKHKFSTSTAVTYAAA